MPKHSSELATLQIEAPETTQGTSGMVMAGIVVVSVIGAAAIVGISLARPNQDNTALITAVIGFLGPTAAALLALAKSVQTGTAVRELHLAVNSRLTQLLEQTAQAAESKGRADATDLATVKAVTVAAEQVIVAEKSVRKKKAKEA